MKRLMYATVGFLVFTASAPGNFSITSPSANQEFQYNSNIGGLGGCTDNEQGTFWVEYDSDGGGGNPPTTWQSTNVSGVMGSWGATLTVPTNPGYWHDLGATTTVQLKTNPGDGAAGTKNVKITDYPN